MQSLRNDGRWICVGYVNGDVEMPIPEDEFSVSGREDSVFSAGLLAELDLDISLSFDYPETPLLRNTLEDMWVEENSVNNVTNAGLFDFTNNRDCNLEDLDLDDESQGL
ncbi:hypothetical protein K4K55_000525 [Colletotrichum sp. SAR 10_96]|nr:hypothetical protein K4K55_000525 [Colletotrichum sp. SAR 10_96]